jgi:hypothetical protein
MAMVLVTKIGFKEGANLDDVRAATKRLHDWQAVNFLDAYHCNFAVEKDGVITMTTVCKPDSLPFEDLNKRYKDYPDVADFPVIKGGLDVIERHITCSNEAKANATAHMFKKEFPDLKLPVVVAEINLADYPKNKFTFE